MPAVKRTKSTLFASADWRRQVTIDLFFLAPIRHRSPSEWMISSGDSKMKHGSS
jgi:hypothetical protein